MAFLGKDRKCHASRRLPDVILRRSFTRPSTALAVIEGLGTRLHTCAYIHTQPHTQATWEEGCGLGMRLITHTHTHTHTHLTMCMPCIPAITTKHITYYIMSLTPSHLPHSTSAQKEHLLCEEEDQRDSRNIVYCGYCSTHHKKMVITPVCFHDSAWLCTPVCSVQVWSPL